MSKRHLPRLVIAGTSSGVGKTTVAVALVRALRARGLRVAVFKCGPDYLDPTYHRVAAGRTSHNLDGFMMGREAVLATFLDETCDADVAIVEGVMGLFDGRGPDADEGSTAEIARWLDAPVLLVVDASGMARSVAALAQGFARFDPAVHVAGVVCNQVGSIGHLSLLTRACTAPPVLGGMLREATAQFPSRHLGLHAADDALCEPMIDTWAERLSHCTDLDRLLEVARTAPPLDAHAVTRARRPTRCRIGIAQDAAFFFYYPFNLRLLEALGAELVPFSPIVDRALPAVDGLYFGGGYPELHAPALEGNASMRAAVRAFVASGRPVYAECGGLMYLSEAIVTRAGAHHAMTSVLHGTAVMEDKLAALGYVEVETCTPTLLGPSGLRFRGHQFRYSTFLTAHPGQAYRLRTRHGEAQMEGYGTANVLASYVHAHWASNEGAAEGFVDACAGAR